MLTGKLYLVRFVLFQSDWTMNSEVHEKLIEAEIIVKIEVLFRIKEGI